MFKIHNDKAIFEDIIDNLMIDEILSKDIKYRDDKDVLHTLTFGTEEHTNACIEFKADVLNPLNRAKKRLKILKFLSEQNSVYVNIINIIKKKESKFSYIKDVIRELREYVKVGEVEKKKFGEVMTPLELVKDMMATLPEEVWSNPNLKWLDNSNGCGPFPAYVIYKLMVGLSEWQPDEDLRYKHIIENMIYVAELQPKNMFLWLFTIDPKDEYKPNIYCGSFLESGFEYHKKNVWGIDKFDMIIGNPPYNEEFSLSGTAKSLDKGEYYYLCHPKVQAAREQEPIMFEHFTSEAIKVIMLAQEEARRLGHNFVGTEQILLGLMGEGTGVAAKVLTELGVTLKDGRREVEKIIGRGSGFVPPEIPFTPKVKSLFEQSFKEAHSLGHNYINTEHLLLGLTEAGEGVAAKVLQNLGVDLKSVRAVPF